MLRESEAKYNSSINGLAGALWRGSIDEFTFIDNMVSTIDFYMSQAWLRGAASAGFSPGELSDEENAARRNFASRQFGYLPDLAAFITRNNKASGRLFKSLKPRLDLWARKYNDAYLAGFAMSAADEKAQWQLGATEKHCSTCSKLDGQVRRMSFWQDHVMPGNGPNSQLECQGWRCDCRLVPTSAPLSRGRLPSLP